MIVKDLSLVQRPGLGSTSPSCVKFLVQTLARFAGLFEVCSLATHFSISGTVVPQASATTTWLLWQLANWGHKSRICFEGVENFPWQAGHDWDTLGIVLHFTQVTLVSFFLYSWLGGLGHPSEVLMTTSSCPPSSCSDWHPIAFSFRESDFCQEHICWQSIFLDGQAEPAGGGSTHIPSFAKSLIVMSNAVPEETGSW